MTESAVPANAVAAGDGSTAIAKYDPLLIGMVSRLPTPKKRLRDIIGHETNYEAKKDKKDGV